MIKIKKYSPSCSMTEDDNGEYTKLIDNADVCRMLRLSEAVENAREVYRDDEACMECLDYIYADFTKLTVLAHNPNQEGLHEKHTGPNPAVGQALENARQQAAGTAIAPVWDSKERGLYEKYRVERVDGKPLKGGCVVLEWGDKSARLGIREFSAAVKASGYKKLSKDLDKRLDKWEGCVVFSKLAGGAEFFFAEGRHAKLDEPINGFNTVILSTGKLSTLAHDDAVTLVSKGKYTYEEHLETLRSNKEKKK